MNAKFKTAALSAVMMAGLMAAGAASAQIAVGGGATLPKPLYDDILPLPSNFGAGNVSYSGTGSGTGKSAFVNNNATVFNDETQASRPAWPATQSVHFAGSDSALSSGELSTYNTNAAGVTGWGPLIQIPFAGTPVLIPYKRTGISNLDLTNAKMCAIFSNKAGGQTWGQVRGTADATTVKVVYRSDSSGTTELLSRYLVAACPGSGFVVSSTFTAVVAGAVAGGTIPAHWVAVAGSSGMSNAFTTDARVGYLSPDPTYTGSSNAVVAKINTFLPVPASVRASIAKQVPPSGAAASNPLAWVPTYVLPTTEYPIFGTTNLLVNQCYKNATIQQRVKDLVTNLTGTSLNSAIETTHKLVYLPDGTLAGTPPTANNNWKKAIADNFLDANSSLSIGYASVCNGKGRP